MVAAAIGCNVLHLRFLGLSMATHDLLVLQQRKSVLLSVVDEDIHAGIDAGPCLLRRWHNIRIPLDCTHHARLTQSRCTKKYHRGAYFASWILLPHAQAGEGAGAGRQGHAPDDCCGPEAFRGHKEASACTRRVRDGRWVRGGWRALRRRGGRQACGATTNQACACHRRAPTDQACALRRRLQDGRRALRVLDRSRVLDR
ncbi:hypothetical protein BC828DRAFT_48931 [Blastocladiella britannica]|nr:hypothetical protein BC828DRAFT_48931 [Blastocladiella britannica]